jgi:hypothetical protein
MGAAREPDQADFDLERFIEMFDEALTSKDERVVNALQSLMMMVILTKSDTGKHMSDRNPGPLRRMYEDVNQLNRRMRDMEDNLRSMQRQKEDYYKWDDLKKYSMQTSTRDVFKQSYEDELAKISRDFAIKVNGGKI